MIEKQGKGSTGRAILEGISFLLALVILASLIFMLLFGSNGYPEIRELREKIMDLSNTNRSLTKENDLLWDESIYRKTEEYLEDVARKELGYGVAGEHIVRWVNPDLIPVLPRRSIQKPNGTPSPPAIDENPPPD